MNLSADASAGTSWLVLVASDGAASSPCNITVVVLNVNDMPSFVSLPPPGNISVREDSADGSEIRTLVLSDEDADQSLFCYVVETLCVNDGRTLDYQVR